LEGSLDGKGIHSENEVLTLHSLSSCFLPATFFPLPFSTLANACCYINVQIRITTTIFLFVIKELRTASFYFSQTKKGVKNYEVIPLEEHSLPAKSP
jgi:hypothetical protein